MLTVAVLLVCCCLNGVRRGVSCGVVLWLLYVVILLILSRVWVLLLFVMRYAGVQYVLVCSFLYVLVVLFVLVWWVFCWGVFFLCCLEC